MTDTAPSARQVPSVEVVYAGGTSTISATPQGYIASGRAFNLIGLLEERFPYFDPGFTIGRRQVAYTGFSENATPATWTAIDEKITASLDRQATGVLVTYGTDSMEQFVQHLQATFMPRLRAHGQKIVLTGATRDIEDPATDAWDNLMLGLESCAGPATAGIYVAFHGRLIPGDEVEKLPYTPGAAQSFVSRKSTSYAASSAQQSLTVKKQVEALLQKYKHRLDDETATIYSVNTVNKSPQPLLDKLALHEHTKAIILNLYRCGTANTETPGKSVVELINYLRVTKGIVCFGVTENGEPVNLREYETSVKLRQAGLVPLYNMLAEVALTKLYLLDKSLSPTERIKAMLHNDIGEIDERLVQRSDITELCQLYTNNKA